MSLPKTTIIGKKIPKKRFYENIVLNATLKKSFVDDLESVTFLNKISQETTGLKKTKEVEEILIFELKLKKETKNIDKIIEIIDKSVPYPILFIYETLNKTNYVIASKRRSETNINKSIVDLYMKKELKTKDKEEFEKQIAKSLNAINIKNVYDNILKLFVHKKEKQKEESDSEKLSIEEQLEKEKKHQEITSEIEKTEKLMLKEKQADRQYQLHNKIKQLKEELKR